MLSFIDYSKRECPEIRGVVSRKNVKHCETHHLFSKGIRVQAACCYGTGDLVAMGTTSYTMQRLTMWLCKNVSGETVGEWGARL